MQPSDVPAFNSGGYANSTNYPLSSEFVPQLPPTNSATSISNVNPTAAVQESNDNSNTEQTATATAETNNTNSTDTNANGSADTNNVVMGIPLSPTEIQQHLSPNAPNGLGLTPAEMMLLNMQTFHTNNNNGDGGAYPTRATTADGDIDSSVVARMFSQLPLPKEHLELVTSTFNVCKSLRIYAIAELISVILVALSFKLFLFLLPFPVIGFIGGRKYHVYCIAAFVFSIPFLLAGRVYDGVGLFRHYSDSVLMRVLLCCVLALSCALDLYVFYVGCVAMRFLRASTAAAMHVGVYGGFIMSGESGEPPKLIDLLRIGWVPPSQDDNSAENGGRASQC